MLRLKCLHAEVVLRWLVFVVGWLISVPLAAAELTGVSLMVIYLSLRLTILVIVLLVWMALVVL